MEIKTKYNIGDTLWTVSDGMEIVSFEVDGINVTTQSDRTNVFYQKKGAYELIAERSCFPTREALTARLGLTQE